MSNLVVLGNSSQDQSSHLDSLMFRDLVIAEKILGSLLVVMENQIGVRVFCGNHSHPELSHEEDLVADRNYSVVLKVEVDRGQGRKDYLVSMIVLDPVGQLPYKVEEELGLGNGQY